MEHETSRPRSPGETRRIWLIWGLLALLLAVNLSLHEMWRDELQAFGLARDAANPVQLMHNLRYEGHPGLYHLLLWGASGISHSVVVLKVVNWLLVVAAGGVVLWKAPFHLAVRASLVGGYFFLYEYGTISRNYSLTLLLAVLAFAAWPWRGWRWWAALGAAFLLCQTSAYGALLAIAVAAALATDLWQRRGLRGTLLTGKLWILVAAMGASLLLAGLQAMPPADSGYAARPQPTLARTLSVGVSSFEAMFPVRGVSAAFWRGNVLLDWGPPWMPFVLSAGGITLVCLMLWALRRSRPAVALLGVLVALVYVFSVFRFTGDIRHHGHQWMALLGAWWIARAEGLAPLRGSRGRSVARGAILASLCVSVLVGLQATITDWLLPFSLSRRGAAMVARHVRDDAVVLAQTDATCSAVALRLDRPLRYLQTGELGTWIAWSNRRRAESPDLIIAAAGEGAASRQEVWLLTNRPIGPEARAAGFEPVDKVDECNIVDDEKYYLYRLRR